MGRRPKTQPSTAEQPRNDQTPEPEPSDPFAGLTEPDLRKSAFCTHNILWITGPALFASIMWLGADMIPTGTDAKITLARSEVPLFDYSPCFAKEPRDYLYETQAKVVFMVVDALRYDFLANRTSPMKYTRRNIEEGRAILFKANVQAPTVTMPRIKSLTSGIAPNFASLFNNFFAKRSEFDSWVDGAKRSNWSMHFYGDDTWLRLFPDAFTVAHGVNSFYVDDYTEVDNNVTIRVKENIKGDWDGMILHYLGLDHIGHSRGGKSPLIKEKLAEMDNMIEYIFDELKPHDRPIVLFVVGDHGMTDGGSHGGNSKDETQVPVVIFHSKAQILPDRKWNWDKVQDIEQLDVANTVSMFLNVRFPVLSRGYSILPYIAKHWFVSMRSLFFEGLYSAIGVDSGILADMKKVRMVLKQKNTSNYQTACNTAYDFARTWKNEIRDALKQYQADALSVMKEDWSQTKIAGCGVLTISILSIWQFILIDFRRAAIIRRNRYPGYANWTFAQSLSKYFSWQTIVNCTFLLIVSIIPFATSFIEQEADFWFFMAQAVILIRVFIYLRHDIRSGATRTLKMSTEDDKKKEKFSQRLEKRDFLSTAGICLILQRIAWAYTCGERRRWREGEGLSKPYFEFSFENSDVFHFLSKVDPLYLTSFFPITMIAPACLLFFYKRCSRIIRMRFHLKSDVKSAHCYLLPVFVIMVCYSVLVDIHERGYSVMAVLGLSQETIVSLSYFIPSTAAISLFSLLFLLGADARIALVAYFINLHIPRPKYLMLIVVIFELGFRARQLGIRRHFLVILFSSALFYTGYNNSFSGIDVGIAYKSLPVKHEVFAGFQMVLNIYVGVFVFLCGYGLCLPYRDALIDDEDHMDSEKAFEPHYSAYLVAIRTWITCVSLLSIWTFYKFGHIMIWTVFSPKVYLEVINMFFISLIMTIPLIWKAYIKGDDVTICDSQPMLSPRARR